MADRFDLPADLIAKLRAVALARYRKDPALGSVCGVSADDYVQASFVELFRGSDVRGALSLFMRQAASQVSRHYHCAKRFPVRTFPMRPCDEADLCDSPGTFRDQRWYAANLLAAKEEHGQS